MGAGREGTRSGDRGPDMRSGLRTAKAGVAEWGERDARLIGRAVHIWHRTLKPSILNLIFALTINSISKRLKEVPCHHF